MPAHKLHDSSETAEKVGSLIAEAMGLRASLSLPVPVLAAGTGAGSDLFLTLALRQDFVLAPRREGLAPEVRIEPEPAPRDHQHARCGE